MIVFRLGKKKYKDDLRGTGAEKAGGRWNSKGNAVVYTSESRSLCTAEIAVHTPLGNLPTDYYLTTIEIPDTASILELLLSEMPPDWKSFPHAGSTQLMGDQFIQQQQYLVLKVPSVVVQGDCNFLINPVHRNFGAVKIIGNEPFEFDKRLFIK